MISAGMVLESWFWGVAALAESCVQYWVRNPTLFSCPKPFIRAVERVIWVLTAFCVIQLFSHEISDHRLQLRLNRKNHHDNGSKRSKNVHCQSLVKEFVFCGVLLTSTPSMSHLYWWTPLRSYGAHPAKFWWAAGESFRAYLSIVLIPCRSLWSFGRSSTIPPNCGRCYRCAEKRSVFYSFAVTNLYRGIERLSLRQSNIQFTGELRSGCMLMLRNNRQFIVCWNGNCRYDKIWIANAMTKA